MIIITVLSYWISVLFNRSCVCHLKTKTSQNKQKLWAIRHKSNSHSSQYGSTSFSFMGFRATTGPCTSIDSIIEAKTSPLVFALLTRHSQKSLTRGAASADTTRSSALDASSFLVDAGFWTDQIVSLCLWKCLVCILHILCGSDR